MSFRKTSLVLYFLIFLHLQYHFLHVISRSTTHDSAIADPNHDNFPVQSVESKPDGDAFAGKTTELAIVVHKGGGGSFGGGGRSFGAGGRSFGGGGRGGGVSGRPRGGGTWFPFFGGGGSSGHRGHRSSGGREGASVWLGLWTLVGFFI